MPESELYTLTTDIAALKQQILDQKQQATAFQAALKQQNAQLSQQVASLQAGSKPDSSTKMLDALIQAVEATQGTDLTKNHLTRVFTLAKTLT